MERFARQITRFVKSAGETASGLFFPRVCASCRADIDQGWLCDVCARGAWRIVPPRCERCSQPFEGEIDVAFVCPNCADRHFYFDCAVAACQARGVVRNLILRFKYNRQEFLRRQLAEWLAETLRDERIIRQKPDAFVPVPLFHRRRRERGYNQAELLCQVLAEQTRTPVLHILRRVRHTKTQTAFDRAERMENLRNAFQMRNGSAVRSLHLLLVDDVLTTGSTLNECARVLRDAGAASVRAICVARG